MKKVFINLIIALSFIAYAKLPSGGISLDFSTIKLPDQQIKSVSENLILDGNFTNTETLNKKSRLNKYWLGHAWVHRSKYEHFDKIISLCSRSIENGVVTIFTSKEIINYLDEKGQPSVSNKISQLFEIPKSDKIRKLGYSFDLKGKGFDKNGAIGYLFTTFYKTNENGKNVKIGKIVQKAIPFSDNEFKEVISTVSVPKEATKVNFMISFYGSGKWELKNVKANFIQATKMVDVIAYPATMLDNLFQIAKEQTGTILFTHKNDTGRNLKTFDLELFLPENMKFLDAHKSAKIISENSNKVIIRHNVTPRSVENYEPWHMLSIIVKTNAKVGTKQKLKYRVIENGNYGETKELNIEVVEPINNITMPKIFRTGCMNTNGNNYSSRVANDFAKDYASLGFNVIHGGSSKEVNAELKKQNVEQYFQPYWLCNGYRLGEGKKNDDVRFQLIDGTYRKDMAMCPVAVVSEEGYSKHIEPMLKKVLKDYDQIMPNWEVYVYDNIGCFCPRCRSEFIIYMNKKATSDDIKQAWPKNIIAKYNDDWKKFRSLQHAKLVKFLNKKIKEIGKSYGKKSFFMPEIASQAFIANRQDHFAQYSVYDYYKDIEWIEPWGPYIFNNVAMPYIYYPGIQLIHFEAMRQTREAAPDIKMINLPQGIQCFSWFTEPEAVGFEFLSCFVNRWEGAIGYYYPNGYDYRYLKASAIANNQIAKYENIVFKGKNISKNIEVTPETKLPKPVFPIFWSEGGNFLQRYPRLKDIEILQSVAYEYQDKIVVAVGNFWMKGENFQTIKIKDLKAREKYSVTLDDQSLGTFTGEELAKGFLSHTGALRWSFILIEPTKVDVKANISQEEIKSLMNERKGKIEETYKWEEKYYKKFHEEASSDLAKNDFTIFYAEHNGNIKLEAKGERIVATTPNYTVSIDPAKGGILDAFRSGNETLMDESLHLGAIGFWNPSVLIRNGYLITNSGQTKNGVFLELSRRVSKRDSIAYANLNIIRRYEFESSQVKILTTIENKSDKDISFSFRSHNNPMGFSSKNGKIGHAKFGDGTVYKREYKPILVAFAENDDRVNKAHKIKKIDFYVKSNEVTFEAPFLKSKLVAKPGKEQLQSFYIWDGNVNTPSFEPIYKYKTLKPDASITYSIIWQVIK